MLCEGHRIPASALRYRQYGDFFDLLRELGVSPVISREYENFLLAINPGDASLSFQPLPHPSGMAYDRRSGRLHVAATRNPNQVFCFSPVRSVLPRSDIKKTGNFTNTYVPAGSSIYPGCLYLHDLALMGLKLLGNAVGMNAIVELKENGVYHSLWHPECVKNKGKYDEKQNHLQLNSIAVGKTLRTSYFSASCEKPGRQKPGTMDFPVDGRGVIFCGNQHEPVCRGLTRPHSARLHRGKLYVDNSGYGTLCRVNPKNGDIDIIAKLPGWTRGLCFQDDIALVGTSKVLPRFEHYAPGLQPEKCKCGIHAVCLKSGKILAGITWARGNQIFSVEALPSKSFRGFAHAFPVSQEEQKRIYYAFQF